MTKRNRTDFLTRFPSPEHLLAAKTRMVKERIGSVWNDDPMIADEESFANIDQCGPN